MLLWISLVLHFLIPSRQQQGGAVSHEKLPLPEDRYAEIDSNNIVTDLNCIRGR